MNTWKTLPKRLKQCRDIYRPKIGLFTRELAVGPLQIKGDHVTVVALVNGW